MTHPVSEVSAQADASFAKRALREIRDLRARVAELEQRGAAAAAPMAIVGASIRAPGGVRTLDDFARLLWAGEDAITEIPATRWTLAEWLDDRADAAGKMYTRFGGFLDDIDQFDAEFFGIAPVEAASMDPQQRLLLELAWEALEQGGIAPSSLAGTRTGVYLGIANSDYGRALLRRPELIDAYFASGSAPSVAAGRLSYVLGLHGPAVSVDTACSSSLVAMHMAVQALRAGECDLALVGGSNLVLSPELNVNFCRAGMMSRDGRCRTFDAAAAGYVRSEGAGMIVLRRLEDAQAGGERVLATVRGSAVNQDGRSNGLTAPNGPAQEAVITAALAQAQLQPSDLGYVEAHGTGTSLGDPIELQALAGVLCADRPASSPLYVGSVKANIGHLEAAAGIAGVIKAMMVLQRGEIPPSVHFTTPNPLFDWDAYPVRVPVSVVPWSDAAVRRAGVSSFGFSGTNAHVILESAPPVKARPASQPTVELLTLSARDERALNALAESYVRVLGDLPANDLQGLADVCGTSNVGRSTLPHRLSVLAGDAHTMRSALSAWRRGVGDAALVQGQASEHAPRVAFLFPGQGPQYRGMGKALYDADVSFRAAFDACGTAFSPLLGHSLAGVVFGGDSDGVSLDDTRFTQPALFAIEYALAAMWRAWGIEPAAVLGHSFGEYAAACVSGVLPLSDAAQLVVTRGALVAEHTAPGRMAVIEASEDELRTAVASVDEAVCVAAINGPKNTVVSGTPEGVHALMEQFAARGRRVRALRVSHAFHSPLMEPVRSAWGNAVGAATFAAPRIPFVSTVTGAMANAHDVTDANYWVRHLMEPVQFALAISHLTELGITHAIEMSPHPVLLGMGAENVQGIEWLPSLREGRDAWSEVLASVQQMHAAGATLRWSAIESRRPWQRIPLPTYPFQRTRHWVDEAFQPTTKTISDPWSEVSTALERVATQGPLDLRASTYRDKWSALAELSAWQIEDTLTSLGVPFHVGAAWSLDELLAQAGIVQTQHALLQRWMALLVRHGVLSESTSWHRYTVMAHRAPVSLDDAWNAAEGSWADNPELFGYVRHCARLLGDVITGRVSALETLFPRGSFELATALYERSATMRYVNGLAGTALEVAARAASASTPLRVLEVGAGTGGTTAAVLPMLDSRAVDYRFTDVSDLFLDRARGRFGAHPNMSFGLFDLTRDPVEQGLHAGSFDLILSANCVHAVADLPSALIRLRELLAPGGLLVLVETTTHHDFHDITTGLIEGWQAFDDGLRGEHPLLAADQWVSALRTHGFDEVAAWPPAASIASDLGQHLVVARAPGQRTAVRPQAPQQQREGSPRHQSGHHAEGAAAGSASGNGLTRLVAAFPSERAGMLADIVREQVMQIMRLGAERAPGRRDRLMALGMDSLMAVQLRDRLTAVLSLDEPLPATLIYDHPTIDDLTSLLLSILFPGSAESDTTAASAPQTAVSSGDVLSREAIAAMSDDEIAALLQGNNG